MRSSEDLTKGIVQILRHDGTVAGTGFIISKNLIATCAHVVQEARAGPGDKVKVRFNNPDTTECNAFVIPERWRSPDKGDISILAFEEELPSEVEVLPIGSSAGVTGHKVCTFGFPVVGDIKGIWGHGEVIGKVTERGTSLLQIDSNEITKGFSGAPLWDESRQRVLGTVVGTVKKDLFDKLQNVAFVIPSEILHSICPEIKINDICPYRGLFSFKEDDEYLFFGRDKLVLELGKQLRTNPRFLAIVGSSGSGKSSLVFAGLLPRIQRGEIIGFENAQIVTFRPNDVSPSDNACDSDPDASLRYALEKSGIYIEKANLWEGIRSYLVKKPEIRLVIYADQFETLFSNLDVVKQTEFLQGIHSLLKSKSKVSFLLTIRGDYYDFLLNSPLGEYLIGGQANVRSMSEEEMREAIKKPAGIIGLDIETGLEDIIINDLKNTKNSLPLLEFTLTKLWELRSYETLTHKTYEKIGGASGAIGQWANETYNNLSPEEKKLARRIFTRLIHYGEADLPDSRRRLPLGHLAGKTDEQAVHQLIKKLADAHILVTDCELSKGTETVEIIHDSLLIEWEQLKNWIREQRVFLTWRQRLEDRINEWNIKGDEGNLLRGAPLAEAKNWMEKYNEELNPGEIKYIKASSKLVEKELAEKERVRAEKERNRGRIIKGLATGFTIFFILAGIATSQWIVAETQKQLTEEQKKVAEIQRQLAEEKTKEAQTLYLEAETQKQLAEEQAKKAETQERLAEEKTKEAQALYLEAETQKQLAEEQAKKAKNQKRRAEEKTKEARASYLNLQSQILSQDVKTLDKSILLAIESFRIRRTLEADQLIRQGLLFMPYRVVLLHHADWVQDVVFSPDGKYVITVGYGAARIWDALTGEEITVLNHDNSVYSIVLSPDGKYVATTNDNNTVRIQDVSTGEEIAILNYTNRVHSVVFSPDRKYVATASDNTACIWNVSSCEEITVLHHADWVQDVVFSPDGKYIATASWDNTACIWDVSTGNNIFILPHDSEVTSVVFSPDGKYVATVSWDSTACIWDVSTNSQINVLHRDSVHSVVFSPGGKYVAMTSDDNTVSIRDVSTGEEIAVLNHADSVTSVVFSPDGKYVATASDNTACVWDVSTGEKIDVLNHDDWVTSVVFSPDGKYVATASDNTACVWDVSTNNQINVLLRDSVHSVVFSPGGKYVATASDDNTVRIRDVSTGEEITVLNHADWVNNVVFSPDGKYVATASWDNTACIWDVSTNNQISILHHDCSVQDVVFSPDGKHVATASDNNTVHIWDASTGEEITVLNSDNSVYSIVLSPNGKYVTMASDDNTVRIRDVSTGEEITVLNTVLNHADWVTSVVFSSDGKYIATASDDNTIRIWDVSTGEEITVLRHDWVQDVVFSPNGKYVATVGYGAARIWDASTGEEITVLNSDNSVYSIVFSPDEKYVATVGYGAARIWDASTGEEITVLHHADWVYSVVFSPDGKYVATASDDAARLWIFNIEDLINEASNRFTRNLNQEEWNKYMGEEPYHKTFPNLP